MAQPKLSNELKSLGSELLNAFKVMKKSKEFKQFEKDIKEGFDTITTGVGKALKAAKGSQETAKIQKRVNRVIKMGAKEGKTQAVKLEAATAEKIKKAHQAIKALSKKIKERDLE